MKKLILALGVLLFGFNAYSQTEEPTSSSFFSFLNGSNEDSVNFKVLNKQKITLGKEIDEIEDRIFSINRTLTNLGTKDELKDRVNRVEREIEEINNRVSSRKNRLKNLDARLQELNEALSVAPSTEVRDSLKSQIEITKSEKEETNYDIERFETEYIQEAKYALTKRKESLEDYEKKEGLLEVQRASLKLKEDELFDVDNQISELLNRDNIRNSFRLNISIAFTVLVAIVIIGFFLIANSKKELAVNIFSGEKGIQFITLFLIIISIILFGIMGTLESRELSALLGALSGYILGKTSSGTGEQNLTNQASGTP
ncbi:exported hypothetical protein [Vibrio nigripulchritudo SOn1]|uniref:Uncharacterized protein n=1 Tax=Vibrio nigripulchritudo SOn1 TaxID=1238450 RepID=A0AAV2VJQ3_9VIBR|nr:exported hypothetical protein [Vibrio nigripulchritudo SOn1]